MTQCVACLYDHVLEKACCLAPAVHGQVWRQAEVVDILVKGIDREAPACLGSVPTPPVTTWVTLGKLRSLSVPTHAHR